MQKKLCFILLLLLSGCQTFGPQITYPTSFEWKWEKDGKQFCVQGAVDGFYYIGGSVTGISGIVTNVSDNDISGCIINFDIFDKDDAKVGEAIASTNSLKAGMKWRYQAVFTTPFRTNFSSIKAGTIRAF